jgi:hypothetical protein
MGSGEQRVYFKGYAQLNQRLVALALLGQYGADIGMGGGKLRIERDSSAIFSQRRITFA